MSALPDTWPALPLAHANAALAGSDSLLNVAPGRVGEHEMHVYTKAPPTMHAIMAMAAQQYGDRELLVYQEERVTFSAFGRACEHFAGILKEEYGIEKGDRVAIIMRNYPQWPVAFFAALSLGAIATPMNAWWTGPELEYGLTDSGAKLAIVGPRILERLIPHLANLPDLELLISARGDARSDLDKPLLSMTKMIGDANSWASLEPIGLPPIAVETDDPATIMYTSGTTGNPKGALGTHRGAISNMLNSMTCQARAFVRRGEAVPEPGSMDPNVILMSVPFFHATGAFAVLLPSVLKGDRMICMYKWNVDDALNIIQTERVTAVGGVPTIAWQIIEHPKREEYDLSSIKIVSYGGAPSAPDLVAKIKSVFPEASPGNGWGMTETSASATLNFGEDYVNRPDSAGAPPPAVELKVVSPEGKTLPTGEVGELWCKGPQNAIAYWNKPEASAETFVEGWVVTGDLARLDEEGFLYIADRAKDMLIRGGENVYCIEVENILFEHPDIVDAAIVGIPHKVLGEEVGAVVQLKPGASPDEQALKDYVSGKLAAFKVPVEIQFLHEPLPRNANGKILKTELRDRFTARG